MESSGMVSTPKVAERCTTAARRAAPADAVMISYPRIGWFTPPEALGSGRREKIVRGHENRGGDLRLIGRLRCHVAPIQGDNR